jgi:hypothetical protein
MFTLYLLMSWRVRNQSRGLARSGDNIQWPINPWHFEAWLEGTDNRVRVLEVDLSHVDAIVARARHRPRKTCPAYNCIVYVSVTYKCDAQSDR